MRNAIKIGCFCCLLFGWWQLAGIVRAQEESGAVVLTAAAIADGKTVALDKDVNWKFRLGDDAAWAARDFNDADWQTTAETRLKSDVLLSEDWKGRAWFRLRLKVDETLGDRQFILTGRQSGAAEIYLDGKKLTEFGSIGENGAVKEFNPNNLPIPFRFEGAGEHTLAVRFASRLFADTSSLKARWLINGGVTPNFALAVKDGTGLSDNIDYYANSTSMRIGFMFVGILAALGLLHFLLYSFYRVERANLFYSIYVASYAALIFFNNLAYAGHFAGEAMLFLRFASSAMNDLMYIALLAFVHVAFDRPLGKIFRAMTAAWTLYFVLGFILLSNIGIGFVAGHILIGLTFAFCISQLIEALREKRRGAWILLVGMQLLAIAMFGLLLRQIFGNNVLGDFLILNDFALILSVPVAVSIFLARNFARTNRDLLAQLHQVETLSQQKIEQERQSAELRAENERRAKELEEARQLQLSMLPKKLPELPNLKIAAYMKPATEVGGDYYDFHVGDDGTLTVAVGDATGHGLKAGTVVTATKGLFNNLAAAPDIPDTLKQISRSLKAMNLRGLFMALTILKIKDNRVKIGSAGMPAALIYRSATREVEEISQKALPLGSIARLDYREQEILLGDGDRIVLMSDGFPEMFNERNELFGYDQAEKIILKNTEFAPPDLIEKFLDAAKKWAGERPPDDDVTFVVLEFRR